MQLTAIPSKIIEPNDDLFKTITTAIDQAKYKIKERSVVVISSKIVALCQGRVLDLPHRNNRSVFRDIVKKEADYFVAGEIVDFTFKHNILIPNAGIDKSNIAPGTVVLWPEKLQETADQIRLHLMAKYKVQNIGILITDSHCIPFRWGTVGICLSYSGIIGVKDYRGQKDLYGETLKFTREAKADELACAANLLMGEGAEGQPIVLIEGAPIEFTARKQDSIKEQAIAYEDCIFNTVMKFPKPENYEGKEGKAIV